MTLQKTFSISTAHRLALHEGPCSNFHGHNYLVKVVVDYKFKEKYHGGVGFVIDFGKIKALVSNKFDHKLILHKKDPFLRKLIAIDLPGLVDVDYPPTAENMATDIADMIFKELVRVKCSEPKVTITLWETDTSSVTVERTP